MARKMIGTWLAVIAMIAVSSTVIDAASHMVGGSKGWTVPAPNTTLYSDWASSQSFAVGDTLVFNFTTGIHDVIEVPKTGYDVCSSKNQVSANLTTGPATVTIKSSGAHYFICGVTGHCSYGQKLMISVGSAAPAPVPAASGATPTAAPTGPSSSTGGSTAQLPNSAAPSYSISSGFLAVAALLAGTSALGLL